MDFPLRIGFGAFLAAQILSAAGPALAVPIAALAETPVEMAEKSDSRIHFSLQRYAITHQGEHVLNLNGTYRWDTLQSVSAPLSDDFVSYIKHFLETYPNEDDYWEIVNRNLVISLAKTYPGLSDIEVKIDVTPSEQFPHRRGTVVEYGAGELREHWYFSMPLPGLDEGTVTVPVVVAANGSVSYPTQLLVKYDYRIGRDGEGGRYPDYSAVVEQIQLNWPLHQDVTREQSLQLVVEAVEQAFPTLSAVTLQPR